MKIELHSIRWIGKPHRIDTHLLPYDPGTKEHPNFRIATNGIRAGGEAFLSAHNLDLKTRQVIACRSAAGLRYVAAAAETDLTDVVEQVTHGTSVRLIKIRTEDHYKVRLPAQNLDHPADWISGTRIERAGDQVRVMVSYTNPFTNVPCASRPQPILLDRRDLPVEVAEIYQSTDGCHEDYLPQIFNQRQKNQKTGRIEEVLFLDFHRCRRQEVSLDGQLRSGETAQLIDVRSSLQLERNGRRVWVPYNVALPQVESELHFEPAGAETPFTSGLVFGEVDTMIGPQHLVPVVKKLTGAEAATDDQKFYFGEVLDEKGEYNYPHGWVDSAPVPCIRHFVTGGPFSLQYAKSVHGTALNTGSNTVMRAPHEDMLFWREDLEVHETVVYRNGRMELAESKGLLHSLFEKTTTTEDAQGAWEKRRMLGRRTKMDRTSRSAGGSVKTIGEGLGQRGRWAAMVMFLQRMPKIFYDEIVRARIKHEIPSQYNTLKQLHDWANTATWYLDSIFKQFLPWIPLAYSLIGASPVAAGAVIFPVLWLFRLATGLPKYAYDDGRVGVSTWRSVFRNMALFLLYQPNISRNTSHINDEAKGPFISTAGIGGKTFFPWAVRRLVYNFGGASALTAGIGIARLWLFGLSPFGLVINFFFPALMTLCIAYAMRMAYKEMAYRLQHDHDYAKNFLDDNGVPSRWLMFKKEWLIPLNPKYFFKKDAA